MPRPLFVLLLGLLLLAGCERGAPDPRRAEAADPSRNAASEGDFERAWVGVLPCADCDGIQTRLLLRRSGAQQQYELEETYLGANGDNVFVVRGDWLEQAGDDGPVYRLDPDAAGARRFAARPDGALDQLDGDGEPLNPDGLYRLQRL